MDKSGNLVSKIYHPVIKIRYLKTGYFLTFEKNANKTYTYIQLARICIGHLHFGPQMVWEEN